MVVEKMAAVDGAVWLRKLFLRILPWKFSGRWGALQSGERAVRELPEAVDRRSWGLSALVGPDTLD